jgi:hypothetical protein
MTKKQKPSLPQESETDLQPVSGFKTATDTRRLLDVNFQDSGSDNEGFIDESDEDSPEDINIPKYMGFDEARSKENGVVIMEGDWGGQIYLTCPMKYVKCGEEALIGLLHDLDRKEWDCNEGDGASVHYICVKPGYGVAGGMGGGIVEDGLWVHGDINPKLAAKIRQVLSGEIRSIVDLN